MCLHTNRKLRGKKNVNHCLRDSRTRPPGRQVSANTRRKVTVMATGGHVRAIEVTLLIELGVYKSRQRLKVQLEYDIPIIHLKRDLVSKVNIPAECQTWHYQHKELDNNSTLRDNGISNKQLIEVKRRTLVAQENNNIIGGFRE
ncbi:hypothetical protein BsWGS_12424 [Bradybaena similaris]